MLIYGHIREELEVAISRETSGIATMLAESEETSVRTAATHMIKAAEMGRPGRSLATGRRTGTLREESTNGSRNKASVMIRETATVVSAPSLCNKCINTAN